MSLPRALPWLSLLVVVAGCEPSPAPSSVAVAPASPGPTPPPTAPLAVPVASVPSAYGAIRFEEVAKAAGIDFVQVSGMSPERHFPTANGSGVAIFDYDGDGRMDLYFASCNLLPLEKTPRGANRLYKNLGNGKFRDVTDASGLGFRGFCHGILAGDVDNDGDQDVFLCNLGGNVLYMNNGDGTFRDVSHAAGVDRADWSSSGAFLDYDNDGDLDLYVAVYGLWDIKVDGERWCGGTATDNRTKVRQYCSPGTIRTSVHLFYRNDGLKDGVPHFTDATKEAGLHRQGDKGGHGFGVVAADLNGDGKIDLYVANDQTPAFTFLNRGDGTFQDVSEPCGAAFDEDGKTQSGMGVDAEDLDDDGLPELIRTNFLRETTSLYVNQGDAAFLEQSAHLGVDAPSRPFVKWGCGLIDFDNDGFPDLFVTNGHVDDNQHLVGVQGEPYEQLPLLLRNEESKKKAMLKGRKFATAGAGAGPYFGAGHVGRGSATGDLDDDGRPDLVVNHKDAPPAVLMNRTDPAGRWIRLDLQGTRSNRDAVGAKVEVVADGRTIHRQRKGGGSMESSHDPRLLIGVGAAKTVKVVVRWPSGTVTSFGPVETNQAIKLREGDTPPAKPSA